MTRWRLRELDLLTMELGEDDGVMERWSDGAMGRWGDGEKYRIKETKII
jgi:hypothetical protein